MTDIAANLAKVRATLPDGVALVAVSKYHPAQAVAQAYAAGQRRFAESRLQQLQQKAPLLPGDIEWHFIGHLQTNKVRKVLQYASLIESVDTTHLLQCIDDTAAQTGRTARVLLQVHVAAEQTKTGFTPGQLLDFFAEKRYQTLKATHICGLMAMATNTTDTARIDADFATVAGLKRQINLMCPDLRGFDTLSMGMSGDYLQAIAQGADMVRIGTAIFGEPEI